MTRDYGQEIDQLREELREIKEMLRPKEEDQGPSFKRYLTCILIPISSRS